MFPDSPPTDIDYGMLTLSLFIDIVAIALFAVGIYFRRHTRKDLAVVFAFFNVCLFVVVAVIQMTEVAAALGFGLFAILSIIRLRSEPFSNREIGYFFGALVLGLLNGIGTPNLGLTVGLNALILVTVFVLDHPNVLRAPTRLHVVLDQVYADPVDLRQALQDRLGVSVVGCEVLSVDFVRDTMELEVQCLADVDTEPSSSRLSTFSTRRVLS